MELPPLILVFGAFALMEPITAATHRFVMHGAGRRLHLSHHRHGTGGFEANDAYPVMFAAVVCGGLWLGFNQQGFESLVPIGLGVTLYGVAYALVHDVYVHGRLRLFAGHRVGLLDWLAAAHRLHHVHGGAPYGMLAPIVPRELRASASQAATAPEP